MSRRTEIQVGVTVLVAIAILILGVAWLKDLATHRETNTFKAVFPQAGGLTDDTQIMVNGVRKGEIRNLRLVGTQVQLELRLAKDVRLTTACTVAIRNVGLMGDREVAVDLVTGGRPYAPGEIIQGEFEPGPGEMMNHLGGTVDAVGSISTQFRRLADSLSANDRLSHTMLNFNRTSQELRDMVIENRAAVRATLSNFEQTSATTRRLTVDREAQLRTAMDHFSNAAENLDRLSGRLDSLRAVMQSLATRIDDGHGTVGRLVNDEKLYNELNASVVSLRGLIEDVKAHPKKYFKFSMF